MADADQNDDYDAIFTYLQRNQYPIGFDKSQKRALRRKASSYKAENGILYYRASAATPEVRVSGSKYHALWETGIEYWRLATHYLKVNHYCTI